MHYNVKLGAALLVAMAASGCGGGSDTTTQGNTAPIANSGAVSTAEDTQVAVVLRATDAEGDPLSFTLRSQPTHGVLQGTPPNLIYIPATDYNGADTITFIASDGRAQSAVGTINITVTPINDAPVANAQTLNINSVQPVGITLTGSDPEGSQLSFSVVTQPTLGTLSGTPPNLTYTASQSGSDSFQYIVNDGVLDSAPATVSLAVALPPPTSTGRVSVLGPLGGATLAVYEIPNFDTPAFSTTTSQGAALTGIGLYSIPPSVVHAGSAYLIIVTGGQDFDVDNDGIIDPALSANRGSIHAVLSADQISSGAANINLLTEAAYHRVSYLLAAGYSNADVFDELSRRARYMLNANLTGDARIDRFDLSAWDARINQSAVQPNIGPYAALAATIRAGNFRLADALQLSDPIVATIAVPGARTVEVIGNFAYALGTTGPGLQTFDVSDIRHPVALGSLAVGGVLNSAREGNNLFLLIGTPENGTSQIASVDLTNASAPRLVGTAVAGLVDFPSPTNHPVAVHGNSAYVAGPLGISTYQFTNTSLFRISASGPNPPTYSPSGPIAVGGNYAFLGTTSFGVAIWNISIGPQPFEVRTFGTNLSNVDDVLIFGSRLFVSTIGGLAEYDLTPLLSDANNDPTLLALYPEFSGRLEAVPNGLNVGTTLLDVSLPGHATKVRQLLLASESPASTLRPSASGYVGVQPLQVGAGALTQPPSAAQFLTVDASEGSASRFIQRVPATGFINDLASANGAVFAATDRAVDSFQIVSGNLVRSASISLLDSSLGVIGRLTAEGRYAYWVSTGARTLSIVDESIPSAPFAFRGPTPLPCFARDVSVSNGIAYVTCSGSIVEVSLGGLNNPVVISDSRQSGVFVTPLIRGTLLYVSGSGGLSIFDVSHIGTVNLVGQLALQNPGPNDLGFEVRLQGSLAYMSVSGQGLYTIDISQPDRPLLLSILPIRIGNTRFLPAGNIGYAFNGGLNVIDIANPAAPKLLYSLDDLVVSDAVVVGDRLVTRSATTAGLLPAVKYRLP